MLTGHRSVSCLRVVLTIALAAQLSACNSKLSRGEALELLGAKLNTQFAVTRIRVEGPAARQLVDAGDLVTTNGGVEITTQGSSLFSGVEVGQYYAPIRSNIVCVLVLRKPLMPNIEITGIAEEADTRSAIVEYLFSYEVPPSIAKSDASFEGDLATHTFASKLLGVTDPDSPPINLSRRYKGTAKIVRYDDGWRVATDLR